VARLVGNPDRTATYQRILLFRMDMKMTKPEPPQDVRIVFRNGAVVPCDVKYIGSRPYPDKDGQVCDGWRVLNEGPFDHRDGDRLVVGYMPNRTYVEVLGTGPTEEL